MLSSSNDPVSMLFGAIDSVSAIHQMNKMNEQTEQMLMNQQLQRENASRDAAALVGAMYSRGS